MSFDEDTIVSVASMMLSGKMDIVSGVRQIVVLLPEEDRELEMFLPLRGVESETEEFPVGSVRAHWNPDALAKLDRELDEYLSRVEGLVLECCRRIVSNYA